MQAKGIGALLTDFVYAVTVLVHAQCVSRLVVWHNLHAVYVLSPAVVRIPSDIVERPVSGLLASTACCVFPLGFGWQSPAYPTAVISRLVPGHIYYWHSIIIPSTVERPSEEVRLRRHDSAGALRKAFVRCNRYVSLRQPEPLADLYLVRGLLVWQTLVVSGRTAHLKSPWRNP